MHRLARWRPRAASSSPRGMTTRCSSICALAHCSSTMEASEETAPSERSSRSTSAMRSPHRDPSDMPPRDSGLPTCSIVVATYQRPRRLARCLEALAQLDYPHQSLEVIVVDDGGG